MTVPKVRVGDIVELQRRPAMVALDEAVREIGVRSFGRGLFIKEATTGADIGGKRVFWIEPGDLVVSNIFAWEGAVAVAAQSHAGMAGSHRFMTWTGAEGTHLPYLAHYFVSEDGLAQLRSASPGSAGRNRTLSIKNFEAIEVPLPPIEEQCRIAAHLDRVASVGQSARQSRAYFRSLKARLIESAPGDEVLLTELLSPKTGEPIDPDHANYRITGVYSFGKGLLSRGRITGTETKYRTLTQLAESDVVYSKLGAFEGAVAVVDESFAGSHVTPEFPVFSTSEAVDSHYVHHVLTSPMFEAKLAGSSSGVGARQKRVHPSVFLGLTVPLPTLSEQRRIARTLGKIDDAWRLTQQTAILSSALLPAARNEVFSSLR